MSETPRPLAELLRRVEQVGEEVAQLRRALSRRDRLLTGLAYALRAVAAAALGYYGALAVGLTQGFWAAITAISVTQASYAEVSHSSRDQFIGAIIGGVVGIAAAALVHNQFPAYALALVVGLTLCWILDLGAAGRVAGVTVTIVMLVPHEGTFLQFALFRLGEVVLGAVAALLVTRLSAPIERRLLGPTGLPGDHR
ncbi:FUSC family protein [Dyella ginsengisoli]|uniref:FUSC family protein n=1 Tax=Dyella ginsengisoli TaxID=363848 RepID=UPI00034D0446|nr:FUSC family protein [Dyella ginsengisoli]